MPHSANVISVIVMTDTANMKSLTWSSVFVTPTMPSARSSSGVVPTQNLAHSRSRTGIGLERSSQSVRPSRLTLGKMKRAAMDASTNPARTRLRKGMTLTRKKVIPSPRRGRYLMLNTYTTTSTASRMS